jgi:hypothetical protein
MPHKKLDAEEWCCQYCQTYQDTDYDKVVYHELTQHHAGCQKNRNKNVIDLFACLTRTKKHYSHSYTYPQKHH